MDAGRSVQVAANIGLAGGDLTLIGNSANPLVQPLQRDAGPGHIFGTGNLSTNGGNVVIRIDAGADAGNVTLSGNIGTSTFFGSAGNITITGPNLVSHTGSLFASGSLGGAGGDITVTGGSVVLGASILATGSDGLFGSGGAGGDITIAATTGTVLFTGATNILNTSGGSNNGAAGNVAISGSAINGPALGGSLQIIALGGTGGAHGTVLMNGPLSTFGGAVTVDAGAITTGQINTTGMGAGGAVDLDARAGALSVGAITTNGAMGGVGASGFNAGAITLQSSTGTALSGSLNAVGGANNGGAVGGQGGW